MYQKWTDQVFPSVNFVLSHDGHFGLGGGGGVAGGTGFWGRPAPPHPLYRRRHTCFPGLGTVRTGGTVEEECVTFVVSYNGSDRVVFG